METGQGTAEMSHLWEGERRLRWLQAWTSGGFFHYVWPMGWNVLKAGLSLQLGLPDNTALESPLGSIWEHFGGASKE